METININKEKIQISLKKLEEKKDFYLNHYNDDLYHNKYFKILGILNICGLVDNKTYIYIKINS